MKRVLVLAFLPLTLFALERVNFIKDAGFEKDSEVWQAYTGGTALDSAFASRHDGEKAFSGAYSASCDTRKAGPPYLHEDSAIVIQGFGIQKKVSDLDSLTLHYSLAPFTPGVLGNSWIALYIDAGKNPYWIAGYFLYDGGDIMILPPRKLLKAIYYPDDTSWCLLTQDVRMDLITAGIESGSTVDSFLVMTYGAYIPGWYGCKTYWDDIRLTGYADYDVGVKEILSGDSVWAGTFYKPIARIKNFGRQPADNFLAIAEIRQGESLLWTDTIPHTLPADTEDTLTFDSFHIPSALNYTLTIRTEMTSPSAIDESDEDDELSKTLYGTGIAEEPVPKETRFDVQPIGSSLSIFYSLPQGQSGVLSLYDVTGRRIKDITVRGSGTFSPILGCGVYFSRLKAADLALTRKTVILP